MTSSENRGVNAHLVGRQFITVYRGLNTDHIRGLDSASIQGIGSHWTTDIDVAKRFSVGANQSDRSPHGHVLEGEIDGSQVETDPNRLSQLKVYNEGHAGDESEVTLKPGAKVTLHSVHQTTHDPETGDIAMTERDWYPHGKEMTVY